MEPKREYRIFKRIVLPVTCGILGIWIGMQLGGASGFGKDVVIAEPQQTQLTTTDQGMGTDEFLKVFPQAQAQMLSSGVIPALDRDSYFVTTSQGGDKVFLWYFKRDGRKELSSIYFVAHANTNGPTL